MARLRVVVVEDSATIRGRLCEILASDPDIELVGVAEDGKAGIELCERLRPDVVSMDMVLPRMSGLAATEYVMAHCPMPILIVSSSTNRGEIFKTYDALAAGAVDVLEKPLGTEAEGVWERRFIAALKLVARIKVITHPRGRLLPTPEVAAVPAREASAARPVEVVAIGASTGGPSAIIAVLRALPQNYALPILLVMHLHEMFAPAFAEWLDGQTAIRAAFARDGERVGAHAGRVVLAPPGRHLFVSDGRLRLGDAPERHSCRPSVDTLFESVAREYAAAAMGVLLTGMGRDGAEGLLAMRQAGAATIAQDEASSVVFGMPREAARIGAACQVLPLEAIGPALGGLRVGERALR
jgi:two-component system chemotaxis response regulator CheB